MSPLSPSRLVAFFIFGIALLASGDEKAGPPSGTDFDLICVKTAKKHGVANPNAWTWSPTEGICVNSVQPESSMAHMCEPLVKELDDSLASQSQGVFQLPTAENSTELETKCRPFLEARIAGNQRQYRALDNMPRARCPEGLSQCLMDCSQYNPADWHSGDTGAYIGCRASCSYLCDTGRGGCWNGWCWAGCNTFFPGFEGIEWCYTTKGWSQDYQYVRCNAHSDCNLNWKCAGPCAAF